MRIEGRTTDTMKTNGVVRPQITEGNEDREAVRKSVKCYQDLLDSAPLGVLLTSLEGRPFMGNRALSRMLGYTSSEELVAAVADMATQVYSCPSRRAEMIDQVMANNVVSSFEAQYRRKDGSIIDVNLYARIVSSRDGTIRYLEKFVVDTTCFKHVMEALEDSSNKFATFMNQLPGSAYMIDENRGIIYLNKYVQDTFGDKDGLNQPIHELFQEQLFKSYSGRDNKKLKIHETTSTIRDKYGVTRTYRTLQFPIFREGKPTLLGGIDTDITKQVEAEETLRKECAELERRAEERTLELTATAEELKRRQKELLHHKLELEKVNKELFETNKAVSVLARTMDKKGEEAEKRIARVISAKMIPIVEQLQNDESLKGHQAKLDVLAAYMHEIISSLTIGTDILISLSPAEMRVATMIMNGMASQEIARRLCISVDTVKTHRRNIRRKLNIRNANINLTNYLRLKWRKGYRHRDDYDKRRGCLRSSKSFQSQARQQF